MDRESHLQGLSLHPATPPPTCAAASLAPSGVAQLPPTWKHCRDPSEPPSPAGPILGSFLPLTLVPLGDRPGRHGERAPAVSRERGRAPTSAATSTSGAKAAVRAGAGPEAAAAILGAAETRRGACGCGALGRWALPRAALASAQGEAGGTETLRPSPCGARRYGVTLLPTCKRGS